MLIRLFKVYEVFLSLLKIDFILYSLTIATFIFYVSVEYIDFIVVGLALSIVYYFTMVSYTILGVTAAHKEKRFRMYLFLVLTPISLAMKIYCLGYILYAPGGYLSSFLIA
mmetsp:Transcript_15188/g.2531  ORF Transcript_15188/g.2531 Transcript_15188/m.2531 type:complete len:111 (+) Transcript_15188:199-531(+)